MVKTKNLIDAFNRVGKDYINRLVDDMIDNPDILAKILDDPDLVDAWKELEITSADDVFKSGTGNILEPTHIRLVPSGSGVSTAFPINEATTTLLQLGVYNP